MALESRKNGFDVKNGQSKTNFDGKEQNTEIVYDVTQKNGTENGEIVGEEVKNGNGNLINGYDNPTFEDHSENQKNEINKKVLSFKEAVNKIKFNTDTKNLNKTIEEINGGRFPESNNNDCIDKNGVSIKNGLDNPNFEVTEFEKKTATVDPKNCANKVENGLKNDITSNEDVDFDDILPLAGEFGLNLLYLALISVPFYIFLGFVYFGQIFITTASEEHWCWVPELENLTVLERRALAIPPEDSRFGYSRCSMYVANWSQVLSAGDGVNPGWNISSCQHGWEFDNQIPYPTITSDFGWVCDKDSYQASAQSIFFCGSIVGGFLIGWLGDRYGRIPAAMATCTFGALGGIATVFSRNFLEFAASRFVVGFAYDNIVMMVYILVLEYTAPAYRTLMANASFAVWYCLSACALPWLAIYCADWKTFTLATSIPLFFGLLTPFLVPESARWLLSKGRIDDAIQKLKNIAKVNKKTIPQDVIDKFKISSLKPKNVDRSSVWVLFQRPVLRKYFILSCFMYMTCAIVFDGLVRSVDQLGFDFFISFTATSATECPSLLLLAFILDWAGRRWLASGCLAISCIFSLLAAFVSGGVPSVVCVMIARFSVNMAFNVGIQWVAEMLPTSVRGSGFAAVHVCGYIATIISPYIMYLENFQPGLPLTIIGIIAGLGSLVSLLLPETANKDMPQSLEDSENLMLSQKFWDYPSKQRDLDEKIDLKVSRL